MPGAPCAHGLFGRYGHGLVSKRSARSQARLASKLVTGVPANTMRLLPPSILGKMTSNECFKAGQMSVNIPRAAGLAARRRSVAQLLQFSLQINNYRYLKNIINLYIYSTIVSKTSCFQRDSRRCIRMKRKELLGVGVSAAMGTLCMSSHCSRRNI